jgi:hypothetical protein
MALTVNIPDMGGFPSNKQTGVPATSISLGVVGQWAADSQYYYFCYAPNAWARIIWSATFFGLGVAFTYVSNGDANGMIYFIGAGFNSAGVFSNPSGVNANPTTGGQIKAFAGPAAINTGTVNSWTDRSAGGDFVSNLSLNQWQLLDLGQRNGADVTARILTYTLQNRGTAGADATRAIRNWNLQGSNNVASLTNANVAAATWDNIDVRVADTSMPATASAYGFYTCNQSNVASYRYLRITNTGVNAAGDNFLCVGEMEFYGLLFFS